MKVVRAIIVGWVIVAMVAMFILGHKIGSRDAWESIDPILDARKATQEALQRALAEAQEALSRERAILRSWEGIASFYGQESGVVTSIGEPFDGTDFTAAHRTLPPGTIVIVESLETGRATICRINDYGPSKKYHERIIDVSHASAVILGMTKGGLTHVRISEVRLPR